VSRLRLDDDDDDYDDNVLGSVSLGDRVWSVAISSNDRSVDSSASSVCVRALIHHN